MSEVFVALGLLYVDVSELDIGVVSREENLVVFTKIFNRKLIRDILTILFRQSIELRNEVLHSRLYGIHEVALGAGEDDDTEEEGDEHEDGTIEESAPVEGATGEGAVLEGFEDRGQGVEGDDVAILLWSCTEWIDDWGGVHEELDAELHQEGKVTILGGEGGDDESPAQAMEGQEEHQEGEKKE